jgi:dihydrofolate reductase
MPKKVILYIACSLDGFIARKNHDISWLFMDQDYGFAAFDKEYDSAIMGRKTYDFAKSFSDPPFKGKKNIVVTSQKELYVSSTSELMFCSFDDAVDFVKNDLSDQGVFLVGGTGLIAEFMNAKMLNEIVVAFHPIILGDGIPLFHGIKDELKLKFINEEIFDTGLVKLKYEVL